jgi:hypothetical protein
LFYSQNVFFYLLIKFISGAVILGHVKWVHCHHGMAHPLVADRGDGLQIWRVAANILNKQSQTADSGWSSSMGVGWGANNPPPKKNSTFATKYYAQNNFM